MLYVKCEKCNGTAKYEAVEVDDENSVLRKFDVPCHCNMGKREATLKETVDAMRESLTAMFPSWMAYQSVVTL